MSKNQETPRELSGSARGILAVAIMAVYEAGVGDSIICGDPDGWGVTFTRLAADHAVTTAYKPQMKPFTFEGTCHEAMAGYAVALGIAINRLNGIGI